MKILCLQLARFGDIYQTWPVLKGLKRKYPDAELHFLVRDRFKDATLGLDCVDRIISMNTQRLLGPLLGAYPNTTKSLEEVGAFIDELRAENYDCIVNLTFSPASSYVVDMITHPQTVVMGYTRHSDGFFNIPDDASSYFYSQVGVARTNRIHLTDLFALVACLELQVEDFCFSVSQATTHTLPKKYLVIHVGASQRQKTCVKETWSEIIKQLQESYEGTLVLVGANDDSDLIDEKINTQKVMNLIGKTRLNELFSIIQNAEVLIGCDSVALHIASLVDCMTLNISFENVRFWETGPRAAGSRVLLYQTNETAAAEKIAAETLRMLNALPPGDDCIFKNETFGVIYDSNYFIEDDYSWELTRALYMSHPFPPSPSTTVNLGFSRLSELAQVGLENLKLISDAEKKSVAVSILNEVDHLIEYVGGFVPDIGPLVRWFQAEKLRIGPSSVEEVVARTRDLFEKLRDICQIYTVSQGMNETLNRSDMTWKA